MPCMPICGGRRGNANFEYIERHIMTAPLKHSDPITVDVALGTAPMTS